MIGLGNPGRPYHDTRHNAGAVAVQTLAQRWGCRWRHMPDYVTTGRYGVVLCVPLSFVNRSGEAVAALLRDTGGSVAQALVVCDDVNLPLGRLRLRGRGSDGGHKGLRSVIRVLGTEEFPRLRLGVDRPSPAEPLEEYVLSPFHDEELPLVQTMIDRAVDTVICWIDEGLETAMSRFNAASGGEDS